MRFWPIFFVLWMTDAAAADTPVRLGLFGAVERISPLVVAGREIDVSKAVPVVSILGPGQSIEVGDTLAIVLRVDDGRLAAERIMQIYPVVGPVDSVSADTAKVLGSPVHIPPNTKVELGEWLAVSGFWSGQKAITSNLRRFDGGIGQLAGVVDPVRGTIGGSTVSSAQAPEDGFGKGIWLLSGMPEKGELRVRFMSKGVFGGPVDLALWQGYASLPIASQTYMIHGSGITGTARDADMPTPGSLIVKCTHNDRVIRTPPKGLEAAFDALNCAMHIPVD